MTLMFIDDKEKKNISKIGDALKKTDANMYKVYDSVYGSIWVI